MYVEYKIFGVEGNDMDLENLSVMSLARQNMRYLTEKERVIATNLANANTPGYLPKDIKKPTFSGELSQVLALKTTNPMHMKGMASASFINEVYTPQPTTPLTIDGNGVIIEDQMNQANKTSGEYNRMITIYNKYRTMIKAANTKINI